MKQKRRVSMIGVLIVIISAVSVITGCNQAHGNKGSGNIGNSLKVQPTGKADPALKATEWQDTTGYSSIVFAKVGNIAYLEGFEALYTINGNTISFDLTRSITNHENITLDEYVKEVMQELEKGIAKLEKDIKEAEGKGDKQKKKKLEKELEKAKEALKYLENPDEDLQEEIKGDVKKMHTYASKMEMYAKFEGIFNSEKTQLTIEKFPEYDWQNEKVTVKEVTFEKK